MFGNLGNFSESESVSKLSRPSYMVDTIARKWQCHFLQSGSVISFKVPVSFPSKWQCHFLQSSSVISFKVPVSFPSLTH